MEAVKPEMKLYIWVETIDGSLQQIEEDFALFSPFICRKLCQTCAGSSKNNAILLPESVTPVALGLILDFIRFHQAPGRSNKERRIFNGKFVRINLKILCELATASHDLEIESLCELTAKALAKIIEGRDPEKIREMFELPDDLTEEEKLEPLTDYGDDSRIRLLNRLYAKKRNELKEKEKKKDVKLEQKLVDERPIDDLLSFINGESEGGLERAKTNSHKKKNRKKKDHSEQTSSSKADGDHQKALDACSSSRNISEVNDTASSPSCTSKIENPDTNFSPKLEFNEFDTDDDLDPEMKAQIDREVEDFTRRLNMNWPQRMHEIYSLGQETRLVPKIANYWGGST